MRAWLTSSSYKGQAVSLMRIALGLAFIYHGYGKFFSPNKWEWLGSQVPILGDVSFVAVVLGFMASFSEFIGGICLCVGVFTRPFYALIAITMLVACSYHYRSGEGFELALIYLIFSFALYLKGPDSYALDHRIFAKK